MGSENNFNGIVFTIIFIFFILKLVSNLCKNFLAPETHSVRSLHKYQNTVKNRLNVSENYFHSKISLWFLKHFFMSFQKNTMTSSDQIGNSITELTLVDIVWCLETIMMDLWLSIWCFFLSVLPFSDLSRVSEKMSCDQITKMVFTCRFVPYIKGTLHRVSSSTCGSVRDLAINIHFRPKFSHFELSSSFATSIIWGKSARFGKTSPYYI